ncbi:MAG: MBL fold metallo-hydrolase, partial [Clostridia bacterium]|nr:MBL fold metallo-hydrolase [Clostridia bacterium]
MKITFMGTSHGYAEKGRFTSATLIEVSDFYYLLDAGAPVEWIMVNKDKPFDKIRGIFITHMHNDHAGSLSTVIHSMLRFRYNNNAACFFPTEKGKNGFLDWMETMNIPKEKILSTREI